jgi:hypothetical protein
MVWSWRSIYGRESVNDGASEWRIWLSYVRPYQGLCPSRMLRAAGCRLIHHTDG